MIIAIDAYEANTSHRVGIGEYAYEILNGIYRLLKLRAHQDTHVRVYLPDSPRDDLPVASSFWNYAQRSPKKLWTFLGLPKSLLIDRPKPDVFFSPTHYIPRFTQIPRVMSVMDLSFLHYPELFRQKDYYQLVNWTKYSVGHARLIFTISEFSKNAIIEAYGVPEHRVVVTYPGLRTIKTTTAMKQATKPFILSVGTLQPRKNYVKLIAAFALLKQQKQYQDLELRIVGKKGWLYEEILAAPQQYHVEQSVTFLDFVSDEDLAILYKQAECFVLPSLYEGFGLPVLEAMANGCSVVVSDVSSLPEIAGAAGIYVDPTKVDSIYQGMDTALREKNSAKEKTRLTAAAKQVKLFSWDTAAAKTLEILEKVGNGAL